jgi:hypothetical protein
MRICDTKRCSKCLNILDIERFSRQRNGRIASYCKPCTQVYCREHYAKNAEAHNQRRYQNSKRYKARNRTYTVEYLKAHPCVDCGECDILVLEFDHIDPRTKKYALSDLSRRGRSLDELKREIGKCEVRCIKCHRRRTARQFGWKKGISLYPGCSSVW